LIEYKQAQTSHNEVAEKVLKTQRMTHNKKKRLTKQEKRNKITNHGTL